MDIYSFHPQTGEYTGSGVASPSPREPGVFHLPAHATTEAPPAVPDGKVAVWKEGKGWTLVKDNRGQVFWLPGDAWDSPGQVMRSLGPLPKRAKLSPPSATLEEALARRVAEVKAESGRLLAGTDWYVLRRADTGAEVPAEVSAWRSAVRATCAEVEAELAQLADPVAVLAFTWSGRWPEAPVTGAA